MNDQENLEEGLDFDLDSILSEFGSGAQSQETEDPQNVSAQPLMERSRMTISRYCALRYVFSSLS